MTSRSAQIGPSASSSSSRIAGRGQAAAFGAGGEHVVEAARAAAGEQVRPRPHLRAEAAEQGGAAVEAEQRIVLADLEAVARASRCRARRGRRGRRPSNMRWLATARPSERAEGAARDRVPIAPAGPGAGVEQDREDDEIEGGAGALRRVAFGQKRRAGDEMAGAGVEGDGEVGIIARGSPRR